MLLKEGKNVPKQLCDKPLAKQDLELLKDKVYFVKKHIPLFPIVSFSCMVFIVSISLMNEMYFSYFFSLFVFIFFSNIVGGIIVLLIMLSKFVKHNRKLKIKFLRVEKLLLVGFLLLGVVGFFKNLFFAFLAVQLCLAIVLLNLGKRAEKIHFISKKPISKIVLGDWIVEDVKVGDRVIISKEEFRLGVDEIQLKKIQELSKKHKGFDALLVKDGIAFLPPMFVAFIILCATSLLL